MSLALRLLNSPHHSLLTPPACLRKYTWFHVIFIMASMYTAGLLTDWRIVVPTGTGGGGDDPMDVYIGRSEGAMWMRVVSSWICVGLYLWSLYGPVLLPDRFGLD